MNLRLSADQELLRKTFADFFARWCSHDVLRRADASSGHDAQLWSRFADLGGHLIAVPGDDPTLSGSLLDAAFVAIEAGRRLAPIPSSETALSHRTLALAGRGEAIPMSAIGTLVPSTAATLQASPAGRLTGEVAPVRSGAVADHALIHDGDNLMLVDLASPGVVRRSVANLGCFPMAALEFDGVAAERLTGPAPEVSQRLRCETRVLFAAELVGGGRQALTLAVGHVKERHQFGRPIGSFQAIQHRLADRHTALDAAELLVVRAACAVDDLDALRYYSAVAMLTARESAELAAKEALQFHGGYGFVTEHDVHRYVRFTKALGVLSGDGITDDALPHSARVAATVI